jgi:hypothetical protein
LLVMPSGGHPLLGNVPPLRATMETFLREPL